MWLSHGVNADGELVAVADVPRGKTALRCPWCDGPLMAKKGPRVVHHFAHAEATCAWAARADDTLALPLFQRFHLDLSGAELRLLQELWAHAGPAGQVYEPPYGTADRRRFEALVNRGIIVWNRWRGAGAYELTKLGKIPVGALSLALFCAIQEPLIAERLATLERAAAEAWAMRAPTAATALLDLRLYRAQLRRSLTATLYALAITADDQPLYKIGVTTRPIDERLVEIRHDLQPFATNVRITVLGLWPHRGAVEGYVKHRYQRFQAPLGSLTEYLIFPDEATVAAFRRDLKRIPPLHLTPDQQAILAGAPSELEVRQTAEAQRLAHRAAIRAGMAAAAARGVHVGRPRHPDAAAVLATYPAVIAALQGGMGIRATARATGVAINTVRKVAALLPVAGSGEINTK